MFEITVCVWTANPDTMYRQGSTPLASRTLNPAKEGVTGIQLGLKIQKVPLPQRGERLKISPFSFGYPNKSPESSNGVT
ncbi:hypothetical protein SDC9_60502 [bioreactor metagenome]|uniref:Uncharacterized protein n=1 Tax=bioreactor metagenome TaxID=1076179 RepID=A0A644XD82_9ZZZZ